MLLGLDGLISGLGNGAGPAVVLAVATLLGLRHAADPDHLVAVSTLVATEPAQRARRATVLGVAWGMGHTTTLVALGVPVIFAAAHMPRAVSDAAELAVGATIMALAARLLARWRGGGFHAHEHAHGTRVHRHLHRHGDGSHAHEHPIRTPLQAYGVGVIHGLAGSAPLALLLLAPIQSKVEAAAALLLFALAAAFAMAAVSSLLGLALGHDALGRQVRRAAPALAAAAFLFGAVYAAAAVHGV